MATNAHAEFRSLDARAKIRWIRVNRIAVTMALSARQAQISWISRAVVRLATPAAIAIKTSTNALYRRPVEMVQRAKIRLDLINVSAPKATKAATAQLTPTIAPRSRAKMVELVSMASAITRVSASTVLKENTVKLTSTNACRCHAKMVPLAISMSTRIRVVVHLVSPE